MLLNKDSFSGKGHFYNLLMYTTNTQVRLHVLKRMSVTQPDIITLRDGLKRCF